MLILSKFYRILLLILFLTFSTLGYSIEDKTKMYDPNLARESISQIIDRNIADSITSENAIKEIISESENNKDYRSMYHALITLAILQNRCNKQIESEITYKKAIEISKILIDQNKNSEESRHNSILFYITIFLSLGLMILAYTGYKTKQRANIYLSAQKNEIEEQKQIVDKRNKDITDSLNYARRIQRAIFKTSLRLEQFFSEAFILFIPKDIVSGDFYWVKSKNGQILFALADCTGHGVPGAFMSIIGTYGLNNLVNESNITNPGEILNEMNALFKNSFDQSEGTEIFDGMDICLCLYNPATKELNYSGANLPLHILRENAKPQPTSQIVHINEQFSLYQVKPTKQPIGYIFDNVNYVTHGIQLMEGDILYLFTDGFADQFGGLFKKKYRYQELRKLLCDIATKPLQEQRTILSDTFRTWKGENIQVDDLSFLGVKIS